MLDGSQVAQQAVNGILQRVDALAAKIGTTAAQVWQVYIAQARVEALRDALSAVLLLGLAVVLVKIAPRVWKKADEDGSDMLAFCAFLLGLSAVIAVTLSLASGYDALGELLNPQYWAFQHLTADLKNLF